MKTITQILGIFFGTLILSGAILLINDGNAVNSKNTSPGITYTIDNGSQASAGGEMINQPVSKTTNSMVEDADYWVKYLSTTINPSADSVEDTSTVVEEMENNPTYWKDKLDKIDFTE